MTSPNPRNYPPTMPSPESGRPMMRGEKVVTAVVDGATFSYRQPGWWCSLTDPNDYEGQLVDEDNQVAEDARRLARLARKEARALAAHDPAGDELMAFIEEIYEWPEA